MKPILMLILIIFFLECQSLLAINQTVVSGTISNEFPGTQVEVKLNARRFRRDDDECLKTKNSLDLAKNAFNTIDNLKDFQVTIGKTTKKLSEFGKAVGNAFPVGKIFSGVFEIFSSREDSNCELKAKLNEILNAVKEVSRKIESVEFLIKCVEVRKEWRDMANMLSQFSDVLPANERTSAKTLCNDPNNGIQSIVSKFRFAINENDISKLFSSCAKYESDNIATWADKVTSIAKSIVFIVPLCDYANQRDRIFNLQQFTDEVSNIVTHAALSLVKKHFSEDQSSIGLRGAVLNEVKNSKSPGDLVNILKMKYSYYDWDAVFVPSEVHGLESHKAITRTSINCGSIFYTRTEVDKSAVVAWSDKSVSKTNIAPEISGYNLDNMQHVADSLESSYNDEYIFVYATVKHVPAGYEPKYFSKTLKRTMAMNVEGYHEVNIADAYIFVLNGNQECRATTPDSPRLSDNGFVGVNQQDEGYGDLRIKADNIADKLGNVKLKADAIKDDTGRTLVKVDAIKGDTGYTRVLADAIKDDTESILLKTNNIEKDTGYIRMRADEIKDDTGYIRVKADKIADDTGYIRLKTNAIKKDTEYIKVKVDDIKDDTGYIRVKANEIKDDTGYIRVKADEIKGDTGYIRWKVDDIKDDTGYIRVKADSIATDTGYIRLKADKIADDTGYIRMKADHIADDTGYIRVKSNQIYQNTNKLLVGQNIIRQDIRDMGNQISNDLNRGFESVHRGQNELKINIRAVGDSVRHYGQRGIAERAAILEDVRNYGEIGIKQRNRILNNLGVIHENVGVIQNTQLIEAHKSAVRFNHLKGSLDNIQAKQFEEANKNARRFQVVAGGINELKHMSVVEANKNARRFEIVNAGIGDIKDHLDVESQLSSRRFGVLNSGIETIKTHLIIESKLGENRYKSLQYGVNDIREVQAEESMLARRRFISATKQANDHFLVVSSGILEIRNTQDIYHAESLRNQFDIIDMQRQESVIGAQRFRFINSTMFALLETLGEQGMKSDVILQLIKSGEESNLRRFQWITNAFGEQKRALASINEKQNLTLHVLNEIFKSIEYRAQLITNSFSGLKSMMRTLQIDSNNQTDLIVAIWADLTRKLQEKPTLTQILQAQEMNEYNSKHTELKSLQESLSTYIKNQDELAHEDFLEKCKSVRLDKFLDFLVNKLDTKASTNLFKQSFFMDTLMAFSNNSMENFNDFTTVLMKDAERSEFLSKACLVHGKVTLNSTQLKGYFKTSQEKIRTIQQRIIQSEYAYAVSLSQTISSIIQPFLDSLPSRVDNFILASKIFNYLSVNLDWNVWTVMVANRPESTQRQLSYVNNKKPRDPKQHLMLGGDSFFLHNEIIGSSNMKVIAVLWKPKIADSRRLYLNADTWNCIYETIKGEVLSKDTDLNEIPVASIATEAAKRVLEKSKIGFCSVFSILHQLVINGRVINQNLNMSAKLGMKSVESRVIVLDLYNKSNLTLEVFIDVNDCDQGSIVSTNMDDSSFPGFKFLLQMPLVELSLQEPQVAVNKINDRLAVYYQMPWSVNVLSRAKETDSRVNANFEGANYIHLRWFGFDIVLADRVESADFSLSIPSYVSMIPNVLFLNGHGPCVIEEANRSLSNNFIQVIMANSTFYAQCAGPMYISINLDSKPSDHDFKCVLQAIDCRLSSWSEWSGCSDKVNKFESRIRNVLLKPENGGKACEAEQEQRECNHVDCAMTKWSNWTKCNGEVKSRSRSIRVEPKNGGDKCPHLEETMRCRNCQVNGWSDWSKCDGKFTSRTRGVVMLAENGGEECPQLVEKQSCNDCQLNEWSSWSKCLGGWISRTRHITKQPEMGGRPCGEVEEKIKCQVVDCVLSLWSEWSGCAENAQHETRRRRILVEPKDGGKVCDGLEEKKTCRSFQFLNHVRLFGHYKHFEGGKQVNSIADCTRECRKDLKCKAASVKFATDVWCHLFDNDFAESEEENWISIIHGESNVFYGKRLSRHFKHIKNENISLSECYSRCKENSRCVAVTYQSLHIEDCFLFKEEYTQQKASKSENWVSIVDMHSVKNFEENWPNVGHTCINDLQLLGKSYKNIQGVQSERVCWKECAKDDQCRAASVQYPQNTKTRCHMYESSRKGENDAENWVSIINGKYYNERRLYDHFKMVDDVNSQLECYFFCTMVKKCMAITMNRPTTGLSCSLFNENYSFKKNEPNFVSFVKAGSENDKSMYLRQQPTVMLHLRLIKTAQSRVLAVGSVQTADECWACCHVMKACRAATYLDKSVCYMHMSDDYEYERGNTSWTSYVKPRDQVNISRKRRSLERSKVIENSVNQSFIMATVENSLLPDTYAASKSASALCTEIAQNVNQTTLAKILDSRAGQANGWSILVLNKGLSHRSTFSLNIIENLFLQTTCTVSWNAETINSKSRPFKVVSVLAFYMPESNCYQNEQEKLFENTISDPTDRFQNIINLLSLSDFLTEFLVFNNYKIHRSTDVKSPNLLKFLLTNILQVFQSSKAQVFKSERLRKSLGTFWNVIINPIGQFAQLSSPMRTNSFLRLQIEDYEVIVFHTPYLNCY